MEFLEILVDISLAFNFFGFFMHAYYFLGGVAFAQGLETSYHISFEKLLACEYFWLCCCSG